MESWCYTNFEVLSWEILIFLKYERQVCRYVRKALVTWIKLTLYITHKAMIIVCPMQFMALDRYKITW